MVWKERKCWIQNRDKKPQDPRSEALEESTQITKVVIPWELVRNEGTWAPPDPLSWKLYEWAQNPRFKQGYLMHAEFWWPLS